MRANCRLLVPLDQLGPTPMSESKAVSIRVVVGPNLSLPNRDPLAETTDCPKWKQKFLFGRKCHLSGFPVTEEERQVLWKHTAKENNSVHRISFFSVRRFTCRKEIIWQHTNRNIEPSEHRTIRQKIHEVKCGKFMFVRSLVHTPWWNNNHCMVVTSGKIFGKTFGQKSRESDHTKPKRVASRKIHCRWQRVRQGLKSSPFYRVANGESETASIRRKERKQFW